MSWYFASFKSLRIALWCRVEVDMKTPQELRKLVVFWCYSNWLCRECRNLKYNRTLFSLIYSLRIYQWELYFLQISDNYAAVWCGRRHKSKIERNEAFYSLTFYLCLCSLSLTKKGQNSLWMIIHNNVSKTISSQHIAAQLTIIRSAKPPDLKQATKNIHLISMEAIVSI